MVNICESLINAVSFNKPKMLISPRKAQRLEPKGKWSGIGDLTSPIADGVPPAERRDLTHAGMQAKRGKPVVLPKDAVQTGKRAARRADGTAGKGWWRKRMPPRNETDRGCASHTATSPHAKAGRLLPGLPSRES
jgi:hypothetical protein